MVFPEGFAPGPLSAPLSALLDEIERKQIIARIRDRDHTVWRDDPAEISNRLGWLDCPAEMMSKVGEIEELCQAVRNEGYTQMVLLGMGGSSLAPQVFRRTFGIADGFLELSILDSTNPGTVLATADHLDLPRTLFIVATKSGGTVETMSFLSYFYGQAVDRLGKDAARRHFVAITDPGSSLAEIATRLGFRHLFLNDPNIGGRYSALSFFGLVPAALIGVDLPKLLMRAQVEARAETPALVLGALLASAANSGRDKATLLLSPRISSFGAWIEQLLAESTGKMGKGILPIDGEPVLPAGAYAADRLFVELHLENDTPPEITGASLIAAGQPLASMRLQDVYDLGGQFMRWELATALAGHAMGINPFDQPDVEAAKVAARHLVNAYRRQGTLPAQKADLRVDGLELYGCRGATSLETALGEFLQAAIPQRSYIALQAYLQATAATESALGAVRQSLLERTGVATTLGYGPRFLHSTGQLHKGDGGKGLFLQLTADPPADAAIPDALGSPSSSLTFGVLQAAQALGDRRALEDAGRRVLRLHLGSDVAAGLERLRQALAGCA